MLNHPARHMADVARHLLGEPNKELSSKHELRFGSRGSLSIDLGKGTFYDHETAKGGGVLDLIARETGHTNGQALAWLRDELGIELEPERKEACGPRRIVAAYDYADERGELLFQVVRYKPKTFRQRRPDGRGGWVWSLGGARRVLYRLAELMAADPTEPVFLCEGEKDVDRLWLLGLIATTSPQGAGKWGKADRSALAGRHAVILPDNDEPGRQHAQAIARDLAGKAASVRLLELPNLPPKGDVSDWLASGGTAEELRQLAASVSAEADRLPDCSESSQRPAIQVGGGRLHEAVAASEQALGAAGGVYQRGALLVRVARLAEATSGSIKRAAGSLTIVPMDRATLRVRLTEAARFEKFDGRSEQWRPSDCPGDVAEAVLSAVGTWPSIPPLVGIVQAPTLRADGSVLDQPGYDAASGLLLDPGDIVFPPIPAAPSRAEAERALVRLRAPFADFPFAAEADLAVIISAVLTALVRPTLRAAPAFLLTAPTMASGKTLLATSVSYIATGRAPAMMSQADDAEAERKRLLAVLMEGGAVTVIDNVERPLASDALCSILTEPVFRDRVLGVTRTAAVPTNTTWFVTGNNAQVVGDLTVRVLTCRLDPACERPEERTFKADLHQEVPRQRGELAAAALTIVRAYLAAGSPPLPVPTFGRFEQWQAWCRFPLIWLGLADPCSTRAAAEGKDPVRARLGALLEGWHGLFGSDELTVAAAVKALGKTELDTAARTALAEAMREIAGEKDAINGRRLGNFIARHEGRFERGLRFERGETRQLGALWRVRGPRRAEGLEGFEGFRQPPTRRCQSDSESDSYIETAGKNPPNPPNPRFATLDDPGIDL